ncbi:unnamed protein product [Echinostoma caproni]|uniref:Glycerol-3-phosphate dehydrogenase [NAD(+)] n=1 Tax=Echinostoma caproni TaxID=27848 RepID=A0A183AEN5_9TREM|nr:unnamed protein product [Echinostoma caproni]
MFVHNENYEGKSLADVINDKHINPIYLPGFKIPENVLASCNIESVVQKADILAIVYPSRYVPWLLDRIQDTVKDTAYFITFTKGLIVDPDGRHLGLVSDLVREKTKRPCIAVIGATTALEVAWKHFTEATIGATDMIIANEVKRLLSAPYFGLTISTDAVGVELCGALKNVVAIAAGVADGLRLGDNTKAAVLRLGFWEMFKLMKELFPNRGVEGITLEESCGVTELFVCMSHRSDKLPAFGSDMDLMNITLGKSLATKRRQSEGTIPSRDRSAHPTFVDGAEYAQVIYNILKASDLLDHYPLFVAVHRMCQGQLNPDRFIDCLRTHPVHG